MKKTEDLVSVIIPVYNVKDYVEQCLNSIQHQSYSNIEIIVVDDGSTDGSGDICDRYKGKDNRFIVIHQNNGGLSNARNTGLDAASGQFICFIDSDDYVDCYFIEVMHELMVDNRVDICAGGFIAEYVDCSIKKPEKAGIYSSDDAVIMLLDNIDLHDHVCTKMFKSYLWDLIRFPENKIYEDIRTTYKLIRNCEKVLITEKCMYHYRQRTQGIARGYFNPGKFEMIEAVKDIGQDADISSVKSFQTAIEKRLLRVQCYILREYLLAEKSNYDHSCNQKIASCLEAVQRNRFRIMGDVTFPKSIKLMALLSFLSKRSLIVIYSMIYHFYFVKRRKYFK